MTKVAHFPYRHWSKMDVHFIKMNYGCNMNTKELAEHFNTSPFNIRNVLCRNHISRDRYVPKNWKQWQVDLLEAEFETGDLKELSKRIGKSVAALHSQAYVRGLSRAKKRKA